MIGNIIAGRISNPEGAIKIEMTEEQALNWYKFLLTEKPRPNKNTLSDHQKLSLLNLKAKGKSIHEIAKILGRTHSVVSTTLIDIGYSKLLQRVDKCAILLGDRKESKWEWGESICP